MSTSMTKAGMNYLQSCQYEEDGEVDLDDHGDVLIGERIDHLAQEHQHTSRKGHLVKKRHLY